MDKVPIGVKLNEDGGFIPCIGCGAFRDCVADLLTVGGFGVGSLGAVHAFRCCCLRSEMFIATEIVNENIAAPTKTIEEHVG